MFFLVCCPRATLHIFTILLFAQPSLQGEDPVVILSRKDVGNPVDYFDKNFEEYKRGFESVGELWLGLEKLHQLTSEGSYSLNITMKDFDDKIYVAVYDQFKVGPGDDYTLTLGGFNNNVSTLGDSMFWNNRTKFSTKDRDLENNCSERQTGGWWYHTSKTFWCTDVHLTGQHTNTRQQISLKQITYYQGGDRVPYAKTHDSWKEAKIMLVATTINTTTTTEVAILTTTKAEVTTSDSNKEPGVDFKPIWFFFLISIPIAFTIFGLGFMIRTNCKIRQKCCVNLEKEDENLDYGNYYYANGERRRDVMEVQDSNPAYEYTNQDHDDYDYMG